MKPNCPKVDAYFAFVLLPIISFITTLSFYKDFLSIRPISLLKRALSKDNKGVVQKTFFNPG